MMVYSMIVASVYFCGQAKNEISVTPQFPENYSAFEATVPHRLKETNAFKRFKAQNEFVNQSGCIADKLLSSNNENEIILGVLYSSYYFLDAKRNIIFEKLIENINSPYISDYLVNYRVDLKGVDLNSIWYADGDFNFSHSDAFLLIRLQSLKCPPYEAIFRVLENSDGNEVRSWLEYYVCNGYEDLNSDQASGLRSLALKALLSWLERGTCRT